MDWEKAIDALAQYFRVEKESDQFLEVVLENGFEIRFEYINDFMYTFGYISRVTDNDFHKLKNVLQWNLARIVETEDSLALDPESNYLYIFRKTPLSKVFLDNIFIEAESFVNNLLFWVDAFEYAKAIPEKSRLMVFGF